MEQLPAIEMHHLRYFVAVAEELSFRKAAKRLHVSSPALSIQIRNLEDLLGFSLFKRNTARVRLTASGEVFLREARKVLQNMHEMVSATREAARREQGSLRIGILEHFSRSFMPKALGIYRKHFPGVDVSFENLYMNKEQWQALEEGRIHIGFAPGYQLPFMEGIEHLLVIDAPICAVMGTQHPLAAKREVTLADVAANPLLMQEPNMQHAEHLLALFRKEKLELKMIPNDSFESCVAMLAVGKGVSLLSKMRFTEQNPGLVLRPIKDAGDEWRLRLHAIWKKEKVPPHVLDFIEALREVGVRYE